MIKKVVEVVIILALLVVGGYIGRNKLAAFYYNKGLLCYDSSSYDNAISYFKKSLDVNPKIALIHYALANTYREAKFDDMALEEYKKAVQLDLEYVNAYLSMARIYSRQGKYDQALEILKDAGSAGLFNDEIKKLKEEISFSCTADFLNNGIDAFLKGDKLTAYDFLNKAIGIKSNLAFAHYTLGYFYYDEKKFKEAQIELENSIKIDDSFWLSHKLLGDINFLKGDYLGAIFRYRAALELNSSDAGLYNDLGLALMQREAYSEAAVYLKEAVRLEPENFNIRYNLASVYRDNSLFEEALAEYKILIESNPDYPNAHNDIGDIYKRQGRKEEAWKEYAKEADYANQKLSSNPNDPVALNNLAEAYCGMGDYDLAQRLIEKALNLQPNYRQAYLTFARIKEDSGKFAEALELLDKAKKLSFETNFIDRGQLKLRTMLSSAAARRKPLDKVYLKNGRMFEGLIKEENKERLVLEITAGNSTGNVILYSPDIERIVKPK